MIMIAARHGFRVGILARPGQAIIIFLNMNFRVPVSREIS
jgi:hypothetical protein